MLTNLPTIEEVKNVVFSMNGNGAPGPDGFGGYFFQEFWDIVAQDVFNATLQFFRDGWLLPNLNANVVAIIPKFPGAEEITQYRPTALENFWFKIITKVLADRLAVVAPKIISKNQRGFIRGRQISDCICSASEAINLLDKKDFGGQLAMKIDIMKAFDTLDWNFLLNVLRCFGFNEVFCKWIKVILHSAKLSISVNGHAVGYFSYARGVRQGDPLSPLLFCLAEEVLSRGITNLVEAGEIQLMAGKRGVKMPSHVLYADDIMIFCRASKRSLQSLKLLFLQYAQLLVKLSVQLSPNFMMGLFPRLGETKSPLYWVSRKGLCRLTT